MSTLKYFTSVVVWSFVSIFSNALSIPWHCVNLFTNSHHFQWFTVSPVTCGHKRSCIKVTVEVDHYDPLKSWLLQSQYLFCGNLPHAYTPVYLDGLGNVWERIHLRPKVRVKGVVEIWGCRWHPYLDSCVCGCNGNYDIKILLILSKSMHKK